MKYCFNCYYRNDFHSKEDKTYCEKYHQRFSDYDKCRDWSNGDEKEKTMSDPLAVKDITEVDNKTILECYKKEFTKESVEKILDALRPHGKWGNGQNDMFWCSNCGQADEVPTAMGTPIYNYCPNCGAKMDGKEVDNE